MNMVAKPLERFSTNSLEQHWMPFTANRDFKNKPRLVTKSEGMYLWNQNGDRLIDGSSGLFNVAAGHGRKEIADAVYAQMMQNDYTAPFQLGQPTSFALAAKLTNILPEDFNHVFFVNSGSEAIDTALKIVMAYHRARGDSQRIRFVSRERAYHGVNMGGVSLAGMVRNRETFPVVMPNIVMMRHTWTGDELFVKGQPEHGAELANDLQRHCETYGGSTIAAVFVEPVAGSTGTLVPPKGYLERLREICDQHGILLVFDEVITGFGRLGHYFGAGRFGVTPDIITFAKGVNSGMVPLGGAIVRREIHDAFMQGPEHLVELFHGYTYSAHPLACAAGLAALEVYREEGLMERARALEPVLEDAVHSLRGEPHVIDIRNLGMAAAIELAPREGEPSKRAMEVFHRCFDHGVMVRYTGDIIALGPALIAGEDDLALIVETLRSALRGVR